MSGDPNDCRLNEAHFLQLAESTKVPVKRREALFAAETWKRLAAERDAEEALLQTLVDMELVSEPWMALPEALHLRA